VGKDLATPLNLEKAKKFDDEVERASRKQPGRGEAVNPLHKKNN